jgi:two-component system, NtrC family, sensor kinase
MHGSVWSPRTMLEAGNNPPSPAVILLVDDTEAQRYAVARMLRKVGHRVLEASSGKEARHAITAERPDLVILDVNLPDENGFDICRDLKNTAETATLPVLQVSATFVAVNDRVHGLEGGADAYLTPPLDTTELLATVHALLRMRRAEERARREALEAEHARAELSAVLASLAEGLVQLDTSGRIVYLNPAGSRMLGRQGPQELGVSLHDLVHGHRSGEILCEPNCPFKGGFGSEPRSAETTFARPDGSSMMVEYTSAPLIEEGRVTGTVVSFRDITERRRTEEALRVTEKLASTGRMAATIAHEINNPLEAVTNLLYLIGHHPSLDDAVRKYTVMAEQELGRVTHITRQTLGFYRRSEFPTTISLTDVLESVLSIYARKMESGEITIIRKYRYEEAVQGFAGEIRQVFSNLLINAIEAVGQKGRILIHLSSWRDWRRGGELCGVKVSIADNGPGINAEKRAHIFEPFFTTKGEKGTGLGLWVTQGIVRKHGGFIRVKSTSGGNMTGTCFTVFLPSRTNFDSDPSSHSQQH